MGQFTFIKTDIEDLYIIEPKVFGDNRGYFMETYNYNDFKAAGLDMVFVQDNQSRSKKGVLRGLHFQKKNPQGKLVRVIEGEVYDVAVDIRPGSKTYGKWHGVLLPRRTSASFTYPKGLPTVFWCCRTWRNLCISAPVSTIQPTRALFITQTRTSASIGRLQKEWKSF